MKALIFSISTLSAEMYPKKSFTAMQWPIPEKKNRGGGGGGVEDILF